MEMKFFEVKIGRTSRRGSFETFNSFVAKTEMDAYDLRRNLAERYKGFEVSINNVETIVEFEKPVIEEDIFPQPEKQETVYFLNMDFKISDLDDKGLVELREKYEESKRLFNLSTSELKNRIETVLKGKYSNICKEVINIEKTDSWFNDFKCVLVLKGDLKQMLEENV